MTIPMKKIIILNGWTAGDISAIPEFIPDNPANWLGWTKIELEKQGYSVINPFLKNGYRQEYEKWRTEIEKLAIDENTTLVGWSAGGAFWVRWLGETKRPIHKLILVAPVKIYRRTEKETNFDRFMDFTIDPSIKNRVAEIIIFISNDQPDLLKSAELYRKELKAELINIPNQGHFTNAERATPEFPELIEAITKKQT
jgi:predicted alpha/beta hydrolase family esterase